MSRVSPGQTWRSQKRANDHYFVHGLARPGHPRPACRDAVKAWMPGIADKFTQSAQNRLLWPGMTNLGSALVDGQSILLQALASTNPKIRRLRD